MAIQWCTPQTYIYIMHIGMEGNTMVYATHIYIMHIGMEGNTMVYATHTHIYI